MDHIKEAQGQSNGLTPSVIGRALYKMLYERSEARLALEDEPLKHREPFAIGGKYVGVADSDILALRRFAQQAVAASESFFTTDLPTDYHLEGSVLTFTSSIKSESARNNLVRAHYFPSRRARGAFLLLPHWNSVREDYRRLVSLLNWVGLSCLQMSLPYHDERQSDDVGFARELVSANLGRTLQANRQAVCDARACLHWLGQRSLGKLGVIGSSIGSSIATLLAAHDESVGALCCMHMAEDFARVVMTGTATTHIRDAVVRHIDERELMSIWAPISPLSYVERLSKRLRGILIISGQFDKVFIPEHTADYVRRLRDRGSDVHWLRFWCGHYTLATFPFNVLAALAVSRRLGETQ